LKKTLVNFDRNLEVLDIGCGRGSTLQSFREWGFNRSTGVDISKVGLIRCQERGFKVGKDVFEMDATKLSYGDATMDLVFSEGTLEHYIDFTPFTKEMARVSKSWIVLVQPNHASLISKIIQFGWSLFRKDSGGVKELTYKLDDFYSDLENRGFKHVSTSFTLLRDHVVIVFRRREIDENR